MMKKCLLASVILFTIVTASEMTAYGYGIKIDTVENNATDAFPETQMIIRQDNKEVLRLSDYRVDEFYRGDLDGDGYEELVLGTFSGGAHCCFTYTIVELRPHMPKPYRFSTNNSDLTQIKKSDAGKKVEITMWDDRYSYFGGVCFACSPWVRVAAHYKESRLRLDVNRTKTLYDGNESNLTKSLVGITERGNIELDSMHASKTISMALHLFYTGGTSKAIAILSKYFTFEHPAVRKLFLLELVQSMKKSPFWDDLRLWNHWYDSIPCYDEKPCKDEKDLWASYSVEGSLFEAMTKAKQQADEAKHDLYTSYDLGMAYYEGNNTKQDYTKALKYLNKSCDMKYGVACLQLASMYGNGTGVAKSREKTSEYYEKACDYGYAGGCKNWNIMNGYSPEVPDLKETKKL